MDDSLITATDRAAASSADESWCDVSEGSGSPSQFREAVLTEGAEQAHPATEPAPPAPLELPALRCTPGARGAPDDVGAAQVIEALLFASDTPLSAARLAELAEAGTPTDVRRHIEQLNERYAAAGLSFRIEPIARGYQMMTLPAFRGWLAKLDKQRGQTRLSAAALETLSLVAYKQPIIRADVEAIRGVACGEVLNRLREMGLVRVVGRAEVVGRPMLYGTTRKFLDVFGLASLDDLPPMEARAFEPKSKAIAEVEPVAPPPADPEPIEQRAVAGA